MTTAARNLAEMTDEEIQDEFQEITQAYWPPEKLKAPGNEAVLARRDAIKGEMVARRNRAKTD